MKFKRSGGMKNVAKKAVALLLTAGLVVLTAACGSDTKSGSDAGAGSNSDSGVTSSGITAQFTLWISGNQAAGMYYDDYGENPIVQYVEAQSWDVENGGISADGTGNKIDLEFIVPVGGSEADNFNTMMATGEYPELVTTAFASDTPQAMVENGQAIEITEYVEKYMPTYVAYLDANPDISSYTRVKDEDGKLHYYGIYSIYDGVRAPWAGAMYRRDWVVRYCEPTQYIWDWESDEVVKNGHPDVTPMENAVSSGNLNGWKENPQYGKKFTADYGADPDKDYTDDVIFPSGREYPYTISDWEWMFGGFEKAFAANDMADSSDAYCYSIFYEGYTPLGNFNSSFGGGNGSYYVKDGKVLYDGNSEYMETYIECVREWYDKGWLDQNFAQRTDAPAFFMINPNSEAQGKVGMWNGFVSGLGKGGSSAITDEAEKESFYAMPAPLPLNDKYGSEDAQFVEPIVSYQDSRISSPVVCTTKCQDHSEEELATLFTYFDWTYSREGGLVTQLGLTKEQYESIDFTYDMYEAVGLTEGAYTTTTDEEGNTVYVMNYDDSVDWASYVQGEGMAVGCRIVGGGDTDYTVQRPNTGVVALAYEYWSFYPDKGSLLTLPTLFTSEESETKSKLDTRLNEYIDVNLPKVVSGEMTWDDYKDGLDQFQDSIDEVCEIMQGHLE